MKTIRLFLSAGVLCFALSTAMAQHRSALPKVSIGIAGSASKNSATVAELVSTLQLTERKASLDASDPNAQSGSLIIKIARTFNQGAPAIVGFTLEYFDADGKALPNIGSTVLGLPQSLPPGAVATPPLPPPQNVGINSLQGDLAPTTADANGNQVAVNLATKSAPNSITIPAGQSSHAINFVGRWSDQSLSPRNPGLQGKRSLVLRLLPDATGTTYELGDSVAMVTLSDPAPIAPVIMNAIQDRQLRRGETELTELETPGFRSDGKPNTVFYDGNYNILQYSVTTSDPTVVSANITQNDNRFSGRPSLTVTAQPNAPVGSAAQVKVTCNDGYGGTATDEFKVTVVTSVTGIAVQPEELELSLSPNPVSDRIQIRGRARHSGTVQLLVTNTLGATVLRLMQTVQSGEEYQQMLNLVAMPAGMYTVQVFDGALVSSRTFIKQ